jgi:hypothetical protein
MTLSRCLAAVLVAAVLLPRPLPAAAGPPGAETPQALVARAEAAAKTQDLPEIMACITPAARREMAIVLVAGVGMMIAFASMGGEMATGMAEGMAEGMTGEELPAEEKAKLEEGRRQAEAKTAELTARYEAILERHGVTKMMEDETPLPDDPAAREAETARLFANVDEVALLTDLVALIEDLGEGESTRSPIKLPGEVTDYQIDGDQATARAGEQTLHFVRLDGRWYLDPAKSSRAPAEPEAAPAPGD